MFVINKVENNIGVYAISALINLPTQYRITSQQSKLPNLIRLEGDNNMIEPKYQVSFWVKAVDKTIMGDLKKHNISHYDIFKEGLDSFSKKISRLSNMPIGKK